MVARFAVKGEGTRLGSQYPYRPSGESTSGLLQKAQKPDTPELAKPSGSFLKASMTNQNSDTYCTGPMRLLHRLAEEPAHHGPYGEVQQGDRNGPREHTSYDDLLSFFDRQFGDFLGLVHFCLYAKSAKPEPKTKPGSVSPIRASLIPAGRLDSGSLTPPRLPIHADCSRFLPVNRVVAARARWVIRPVSGLVGMAPFLSVAWTLPQAQRACLTRCRFPICPV